MASTALFFFPGKENRVVWGWPCFVGVYWFLYGILASVYVPMGMLLGAPTIMA